MKFMDDYGFLSNFHNAPMRIGHITFPTVEHYYQSCKAVIKSDRDKIIKAASPGKARRLGQTITIRKDWDTNLKLNIMRKGVEEKFRQHPVLIEKLLSIPDDVEIVEGNGWHDTFWGECYCGKCMKGENHLGKILMDIRARNRQAMEFNADMRGEIKKMRRELSI